MKHTSKAPCNSAAEVTLFLAECFDELMSEPVTCAACGSVCLGLDWEPVAAYRESSATSTGTYVTHYALCSSCVGLAERIHYESLVTPDRTVTPTRDNPAIDALTVSA